MGVTRVLVTTSIAVVLVAVYMKGKALFEVPPIPELEDTWWGPRDPTKEDNEIRPFKINVSDEVTEKNFKQHIYVICNVINNFFLIPIYIYVRKYGNDKLKGKKLKYS